MKTYLVNEMFCSPQGEGARQGQLSLFVRFSGCNLRCKIEPGRRSPGGFDCDTEFMSGNRMTAQQILEAADELWKLKIHSTVWASALPLPFIIFTGGEPMLQLDAELVAAARAQHWYLALETNGTREVPFELDWIVVSPKVAEHAIKQLTAHEVRYVRGFGQALPRTRVKAERYFISPAFDATLLDEKTLDWCQRLIKGQNQWELSIQMHKLAGVR